MDTDEGTLIGVRAMLVAVLMVAFTIYYRKFYLCLRRCGVQGPWALPVLGNMIMVLRMGFLKFHRFCYDKYGPTWSIYWGHMSSIFTVDQKLIKQIFIKDFNNFTNRINKTKVPPICERSVFYLEGSEWKRVRNIMSPTFSGGKLKRLCDDLNKCSAILTTNLEKEADSGASVDVKENFGFFTMDAIAATAFGLDVDSQNTRDDFFVKHAAKIFEPPSALNRICILFSETFPLFSPLMYALGLRSSFWDQKACEFFAKMGKTMVEDRKQNPTERVDFMRLLLDAELEETGSETSAKRKEMQKKLTEEEVISQVFLFLIAGYETTASTLRYISYILATHSEVDEKLVEEIDYVIGEKQPTYEDLNKMKYMEQVIYETLRMYPPITNIFREAAEEMKYEDITIPKGSGILAPVYIISHDPKCFPEPEEFRPERFAVENKADLSSSLFLSFGFGPRNCLGMRLALVETKLALIHMLRRIKFVASSETQVPLEFIDLGFLIPKQPVKLLIEKRDKKL